MSEIHRFGPIQPVLFIIIISPQKAPQADDTPVRTFILQISTAF